MKIESDCISQSQESDCKRESSKLRCQVMSWLAVVGWMVVIYLFSDQANSGELTEKYLGDSNIPIRKLAHLTEYAILLVLSRRAWVSSFRSGLLSRWPGVAALVISFLYALSDEWHQSFVPGRSATFADALVDTAGALAGLTVWLVVSRVRNSRGLQSGSGES